MNLLNTSAIGSLLIQLITGILEGTGLTYNVKPNDKVVQEVLATELVVQIVEFFFYMYLVYRIIKGDVSKNITYHRYFDWSITTPVMLVSFIVFFKYLNNPNKKTSLYESIKEDKINIIKIVLANALMLLFGYLGEIGLIDNCLGIALGFIPFAYVFKLLYSYTGSNPISNTLFYVMFVIWGLYGVAAVLPFEAKNTFYNILDLFAKNAYGLYLYYYVRSISV
jgi:bacteriorhodopsin